MYLNIPQSQDRKINFFLKRFPSIEWSGPAWYTPIMEKDNLFPVGFKLIHFHPVDLGTEGSTTVNAENLAKIVPLAWKENPKTEKAFMGLIHSHHTMGAFFSGTDNSCLLDNATDNNFYCSTVVASAKERYCFAVSYKDQYGKEHIVKGSETEVIMPKTKDDKKWSKIAKQLEDEKAKLTPIKSYNYNNYNNYHSYNQYQLPINSDQRHLDRMYGDALEKNTNNPDTLYLKMLKEAFKNKEISKSVYEDEMRWYDGK